MSLIADLLGAEHQKLLRPSGGCHSCPLRRIDFVPPHLPESRVLLVGEVPGEEDVKQGEPLVGMSGKYLTSALREVGITDFARTNITHCRPPGGGKPAPKVVDCCLSQFVLDEIRNYPIVVLVGTAPLSAIFPGASGAKFRGNVAWHPDFPGQRFYSTYHPSYILRRKDLEGEFRQQIARLGRIVAGEPEPGWRTFHGGGEDYRAALNRALSKPLISLDIETTGLESWDPAGRIRSLALTADGEEVIFVHEDEPHFLGTMEQIRGFLMSEEKHVVGHNIGFDLDWLEQELDFQVRTLAIHDTAAIFYQAKQYKMPSLKELVSKELDGYRYLVHSPSSEQNLDLLAQYNAEDVIYPLRLFQQGLMLLRPKTRDLVTRVCSPSGYVLRKITANGFYLRQDYWRGKIREYAEREQECLAAWSAEDPDFDPRLHTSGNGLRRYLFEIKGLATEKRTEKGQQSTDDIAIKQWVREGHAFLRHLLTLRGLEKIQSTYLNAYEQHLGWGGRIRSSFTNTFTDSGRSSSRKPNVQNIPRKEEIRDLFGVPEGHVLMESDFSQIEFRIMVCLAKDANGIAAYRRGEDAHTTTARSFSRGEEPTKEQRSWAKVVNFALLYGGDAYKVQQWARDQYGLDWTIEDAQGFVEDFWRTYPSFPAFHRQCGEKLVENRGWFESVTGHIFHYAEWDHPSKGKRDHAFRSALNAEAQGPAAQICFLTMIHAHRLIQERDLPVKMVNTVHDSIITDIAGPEWVGPTVAALEEAKDIAYAWVRPWMMVPLVMDHEVGPSWGSLEKWVPK